MNMVNIVASRHYTELFSTHEELRQHLLQIEEFAAVQERRRIAREIHDSLGNALTSLNIQLQTALKLWRIDPSEAERFLTEAQKLGAVAIREVRESVHALRANEGQQQSLEELITCVVENFHQTTGILPSTSISLSAPLPTKVVTTIYRIVQESLTNICKYAQATKVQIIVDANSSNVLLVIGDNGKGFSRSQSKTGFGIQGMKERVTALQGKFNIETEPGIGCKITVEIPLVEIPILETKTPKIFPESTTKLDNQQDNSPYKESFIRQCERKLAEFIGPIASFLVQKAIKNNPHMSCTELVQILAAEIPNSQKAQKFQQHLFSDLN
ncbi:sensor histidine kinase [Fischerella muscicola CCMEE 5323]|uniref:Oxygen sensor histidine kinase NreB n=2 Tax=Hapalosiphonaceae TaxID=1892263 RepID=A0A2N6K164_FISMU|nr:sensor histidine kinase [Fischerella muscicola CCMEE 5323]